MSFVLVSQISWAVSCNDILRGLIYKTIEIPRFVSPTDDQIKISFPSGLQPTMKAYPYATNKPQLPTYEMDVEVSGNVIKVDFSTLKLDPSYNKRIREHRKNTMTIESFSADEARDIVKTLIKRVPIDFLPYVNRLGFYPSSRDDGKVGAHYLTPKTREGYRDYSNRVGTIDFFHCSTNHCPNHSLTIHEFGHAAALNKFNDTSPPDGYVEAAKSDKAAISEYGRTNSAEDFAETFEAYVRSDGGTKDYYDDHNRRQVNGHLLRGIYPNRFKYFDELFRDKEKLKVEVKRWYSLRKAMSEFLARALPLTAIANAQGYFIVYGLLPILGGVVGYELFEESSEDTQLLEYSKNSHRERISIKNGISMDHPDALNPDYTIYPRYLIPHNSDYKWYLTPEGSIIFFHAADGSPVLNFKTKKPVLFWPDKLITGYRKRLSNPNSMNINIDLKQSEDKGRYLVIEETVDGKKFEKREFVEDQKSPGLWLEISK